MTKAHVESLFKQTRGLDFYAKAIGDKSERHDKASYANFRPRSKKEKNLSPPPAKDRIYRQSEAVPSSILKTAPITQKERDLSQPPAQDRMQEEPIKNIIYYKGIKNDTKIIRDEIKYDN
jgi:hypothetical protein